MSKLTIMLYGSMQNGSVLTMHHIIWGDAATWVAVVVAAIGGTVALLQLRQQGKVIEGEFDRNKRRDELLDGQLRELKQREDSRRRNRRRESM